ncbi:MAG: hypothetical protein O8C66_15505 [Candidatus Methanoperedens sp.]|nr:hypothetical protein [Candidatus Methanoperedens sp.]MCZ7371903.1 hypothetical protein [Candidatus Methanoperedens sp.]
MVEEIKKILSNSMETYTKNLNLIIPFILNAVVTGLLTVIIIMGGFFYIFGSSLSSLENAHTPEQLILIILPLISQHLSDIVLLIIIYFLIATFFQSFFTAGAIGMAQKATEAGRSELSTMMEAGKKNVVNLYLAQILVGLLALAGIVFIVPGAMKIDLSNFSLESNTGAVMLLKAGVLLWALYAIIISLVLAVYSYALVIENLGAVEGITAGFGFFTKNKSDVFLLWLIIGIIVIVLTFIGEVTRVVPVMNVIWQLINVLLSVLVIPPLTTLWWVRLYMSRTGKKIYFNELLAHPNDLEKYKSDQ